MLQSRIHGIARNGINLEKKDPNKEQKNQKEKYQNDPFQIPAYFLAPIEFFAFSFHIHPKG